MKYLKILLACTLIALGPITFTGCKSSPNKTAYVAVGSTAGTVDAAIKAFRIWKQSHPLTAEQEQEYANVLGAYVEACELVRASKTASLSGFADPDIDQKAASASTALVNFMNSVAPLIFNKGN